jgi:hypothetical protein
MQKGSALCAVLQQEVEQLSKAFSVCLSREGVGCTKLFGGKWSRGGRVDQLGERVNAERCQGVDDVVCFGACRNARAACVLLLGNAGS